eukprot:829568_1
MATKSFDRDLAEYMIPNRQINNYKRSYDQVLKAINSIAPKSRIISTSNKVLEFPFKPEEPKDFNFHLQSLNLQPIGGARGIAAIGSLIALVTKSAEAFILVVITIIALVIIAIVVLLCYKFFYKKNKK